MNRMFRTSRASAGVALATVFVAMACESACGSDGVTSLVPDGGTVDAGVDGSVDATLGPMSLRDASDATSLAAADASDEAGDEDGAAPPKGTPITGVPDGTWTWVPLPQARCRDGSQTGIGVNLNSASTNVMIYLEGGGACFNAATCAANPSKFDSSDFDSWKAGPPSGIFTRTDMQNPTRDWNMVYVPYCTGDVHAGNNPLGSVDLVGGSQAFVGYRNMGEILSHVVPTFPNASRVLLTGISAGGFGAASNYEQVAAAFAPVGVDMLDDSGPLMRDPYIAACLQDGFRKTWNLDATFSAACGADCAGNPSFMFAYMKHIVANHPGRRFGLIDSVDDGTLTVFFGFGANDCGLFTQLSQDTWTAGLLDIRTQLAAYPNFASYYFQGSDHTSLGSSVYDTRAVSGTLLSQWVTDFVNGPLTNAGP